MLKSKKSHIKTIIMMIFVVGVIFYAFMRLANRDRTNQEPVINQSETEKILALNDSEDYPPTPREVIKRYGRIMKCMYNGEISEEEIKQLGKTALSLYSPQLLKANPVDGYIENLLSDIETYRKRKKTVTGYEVDSGDNTVVWKDNDIDYARVYATFTTQEDSISNKTYEEFLLMKNESNQWKIVGWQLVDKDEI